MFNILFFFLLISTSQACTAGQYKYFTMPPSCKECPTGYYAPLPPREGNQGRPCTSCPSSSPTTASTGSTSSSDCITSGSGGGGSGGSNSCTGMSTCVPEDQISKEHPRQYACLYCEVASSGECLYRPCSCCCVSSIAGCKNDGTCNEPTPNPNGKGTCECKGPWTGADCSTKLTQCPLPNTYGSHVKGTCLDAGANLQSGTVCDVSCDTGYTGSGTKKYSCFDGTLISATLICSPTSCNLPNAYNSHVSKGTCPIMLITL